MTVTAAMAEAYASSQTGTIIYETLEMDHIAFAEPVRIVTGVEDDMTFRIVANGPLIPFVACQVAITLPGVNEDGPTQAKITIDNVSSLLLPYLRDAIQSDQPIKVTYRAYTSTDLSAPGDVIDDMELWEVELTATQATGTLKFHELELQAFPLATYNRTYYPGLQGG